MDNLSFADRRQIKTFLDLYNLSCSDPVRCFDIIQCLVKNAQAYPEHLALYFYFGYMQGLLSAQIYKIPKASRKRLHELHVEFHDHKVEDYLGPRRNLRFIEGFSDQ